MDCRGLRPWWMLHQRRTTSQITDCVSVPALIHVQYDALLVLDGDYLQVLDGATKIIDSLKSRQPDATSHNIDRWRAGREAGNRHPVSGSRVGVAFFQIDECHLWRWHVLCYFLSYSQSATPGLARTRAPRRVACSLPLKTRVV